MPSKHILLLGGTGVCGVVFTEATLEAGHKLTLYLRTPSKLPEHIATHTNLTIIQGTLEDVDGLAKAAACGADTFVSLAGPDLGKRAGHPITEALRVLYPLLLKNGTTIRVMVLSTASYSAAEDTRSIKWLVAIQMYIRPFGGDTYTEIRGIAQETVALGDKMEWTVFRVPLLKGEKLGEGDGKVNACYIGDKQGRDGFTLHRSRMVRWILNEMEERKWVNKCPALSDT